MNDMRIGIDVGGTKIEGVLLSAEGTVLEACRVPARSGGQRLVQDIAQTVRTLSKTPVPVGIGVPGQVDYERGMVRNIVNLDIDELALSARISELFSVPVHIENDVNAAAAGAASLMKDVQGNDVDCAVLLNFGTGLAAGMVRNGIIEHGVSGAVGEIGHLPVDPNGFSCPCGQRGCLETVASGAAVERLWESANPPMPDLLEQSAQGNPKALKVLGMVEHAIGDALQIVTQAYDPNVIFLGGGMAKTGEPFLNSIKAELSRRSERSDFLKGLHIASRLTLVSGDIPVGAIGAALAVDVS